MVGFVCDAVSGAPVRHDGTPANRSIAELSQILLQSCDLLQTGQDLGVKWM